MANDKKVPKITSFKACPDSGLITDTIKESLTISLGGKMKNNIYHYNLSMSRKAIRDIGD